MTATSGGGEDAGSTGRVDGTRDYVECVVEGSFIMTITVI